LNADPDATREELLASNARLADRLEEFTRAHLAERRAADAVIAPLKQIAIEVNIVYTTSQELAATQRHQIAALEARHTWWRQFLQRTCEAGPTVAGGYAGAQLGGPLGAGIGAGGGLLLGVVVCP
jgi:hypothetical protein